MLNVYIHNAYFEVILQADNVKFFPHPVIYCA